jgi:hypothetical protein
LDNQGDSPETGTEGLKDPKAERTIYCRYGRYLIDRGILGHLEGVTEDEIYVAAYEYANNPVLVRGLNRIARNMTHSEILAEQSVNKAITLAVRDFPDKANKFDNNFKKFVTGYLKQSAKSELERKSNHGLPLVDVLISLESRDELNPLSRLIKKEIEEVYFQCQEECAKRKKLSAIEVLILRRYGPKKKRYNDGYREILARTIGISFPTLRQRARRIRSKVEGCIQRCFARHGYQPKWADLIEEKLFERDKDLSH